jgi:hypothetical protein
VLHKSIPDWSRTHDYSRTPHQAAESIRTGVSTSPTTNELVETLVRTEAFEDIARPILETTIDLRDTAKEVNETVKDLKEGRTIKNIATTFAETAKIAFNTITIVNAALNQRVLLKDVSA